MGIYNELCMFNIQNLDYCGLLQLKPSTLDFGLESNTKVSRKIRTEALRDF